MRGREDERRLGMVTPKINRGGKIAYSEATVYMYRRKICDYSAPPLRIGVDFIQHFGAAERLHLIQDPVASLLYVPGWRCRG